MNGAYHTPSGAKEIVLDDDNAADIEDGDRVDEEEEDDDDEDTQRHYPQRSGPIQPREGIDERQIDVSHKKFSSHQKRRTYIEDVENNSTPPP